MLDDGHLSYNVFLCQGNRETRSPLQRCPAVVMKVLSTQVEHSHVIKRRILKQTREKSPSCPRLRHPWLFSLFSLFSNRTVIFSLLKTVDNEITAAILTSSDNSTRDSITHSDHVIKGCVIHKLGCSQSKRGRRDLSCLARERRGETACG